MCSFSHASTILALDDAEFFFFFFWVFPLSHPSFLFLYPYPRLEGSTGPLDPNTTYASPLFAELPRVLAGEPPQDFFFMP